MYVYGKDQVVALAAFCIGGYLYAFMLLAAFAVAVERTFDFSFRAGCNGFLGRVCHRAATTGMYGFNDQWFITGVFKTEQYFQFLAFCYLAVVSY